LPSDTPAAIGIAVNPASGKDVRRLVARASVFDNQEKLAIVKRAIVGALACGADRFAYIPDSHGIARAALEEFGDAIHCEAVAAPATASALDTERGAAGLARLGCAAVLTLGGDGTNNVFPRMIEATIAGAAAGLVACGTLPLAAVARHAKTISVTIAGEADDLALIDAVLTAERFIGARALLEPAQLRVALLTRADPAAVGMTAIGGLLAPLGVDEHCGLLLELGSGHQVVHAPIAPGLYADVRVAALRRIDFGQPIVVSGPGVLAFDGERERVLRSDQRAELRIARDGPWVIDATRALEAAAVCGAFRTNATP